MIASEGRFHHLWILTRAAEILGVDGVVRVADVEALASIWLLTDPRWSGATPHAARGCGRRSRTA